MSTVHLTGKCRSACGKVHTFAEAAGLNADHPLVVAVSFAARHRLDAHETVARQALYTQVGWLASLSPRAAESAVREFALATAGSSHLDTWDSALAWAEAVRETELWSNRRQFAPGRAQQLFWEPE